MLNANAFFQLVSLSPGRTPYSQASLLIYTAHVPRKPVLGWAHRHPRWSPGIQLPSECHLVQTAYNKIRDCNPERLPKSSPRYRHTPLPSGPQSQGKDPEERGNLCQGFQHEPWGIFGRTAIAFLLDPENQQAPNCPQGLPCLPLSRVLMDMQ